MGAAASACFIICLPTSGLNNAVYKPPETSVSFAGIALLYLTEPSIKLFKKSPLLTAAGRVKLAKSTALDKSNSLPKFSLLL